MPRENPIVTRIKNRIKAKEVEIVGLDTEIDALHGKEAALMIRRTAIREGIASDKEFIANSEPKTPRVKKAKTLGQQMGTDAKEGKT